MYQKVLVPVDGSQLGECVLEHVHAVATGCHVANVVLLHVLKPLSEPSHAHSMGEGPDNHMTPSDDAAAYHSERETSESEAKEYLAKVADRLGKDGVATRTEIARGDPAQEILLYAEKEGVDLIIISTHGRSGVTRWAFGSVADKVIRHSTVPVLVAVPKGCRMK
jgi:nucleotide-binding universal stress UspA family protein